MKRNLFSLFAVLAFGSFAIMLAGAQPPPAQPDPAKVAEAAKLEAEVAAAKAAKAAKENPPAQPETAEPAGKFGRIKPKQIVEGDKFKVVVSPSGTRHVVPKLAAYMKPATVALPTTVDYATKAMASIGRMYKNDSLGDCVIAGKMHQLGVWSANDSDSGGVVLATDAEVVSQYHSICGAGDNGCVITDVLDTMKSKGMTAGGKSYKIDGYVSIDNTNVNEVKTALYLFGSLTLGIDLPSAWANSSNNGIWDTTNTGIVGGHDVPAVGFNDTGVVIATWAGLRTITWKAFTSKKWITELYAQLAPLWYGSDKLAPCGVDAVTLKTDLDALGGGTIPPVTPPVPPIPVPVPPTPEPPLVGDVTLTAAEVKVLQGVFAKLGIGGGAPGPTDRTEQFADDTTIQDKISAALAEKDAADGTRHAERYERLRKRPLEHKIFMRMLVRDMKKTDAGKALMAQYDSGALPPGFLDNLAKFLAAIAPLIIEILKLFGIGGAAWCLPFGMRRLRNQLRNADWPTKA